jgi:hypothetical protein
MSLKSGAIGELLLFGKIRKIRKREIVADHLFSVLIVGISLPRTSRYNATIFTSSTIKSYV